MQSRTAVLKEILEEKTGLSGWIMTEVNKLDNWPPALRKLRSGQPNKDVNNVTEQEYVAVALLKGFIKKA